MSSLNHKIDIVMTTYMGEKFIDEQILSIFNQSYKDFKIIVRDDNSSDNTKNIIDGYLERHPDKLFVLPSNDLHLGSFANFKLVLENAKSEYTLFSDQDDVWSSDKIALTFEKMRKIENVVGRETPILVHSDAIVVDKDNQEVSKSFWRYQNIKPGNREKLNRLLVQNIITGCTIMINQPLRELALPIPNAAIMHDWWLALVASAFGVIGHVAQPTMKYRQHELNTIGAKHWSMSHIMKNVFGNHGQVRDGILCAQKQAGAFLEMYNHKLSSNQRKTVECYANLDNRSYIEKVYLLQKYCLFKAGLIRNIGMWVHI